MSDMSYLGLDNFKQPNVNPADLDPRYPAIENNPWTFVFPWDEVEQRHRKGRYLDLKGRPLTPEDVSPLRADVVVIDNHRWNYEVRAYLQCLSAPGIAENQWLYHFMDKRWQDIYTAILNQHKTGPVAENITRGIRGGYGVRSPKLQGGGWYDIWMRRSSVVKCLFRGQAALREGPDQQVERLLALGGGR